MQRSRLASVALLPLLLGGTLLSGCGGVDIEDTLKVAGLLFLTGLIGKRGVPTTEESAPLGRARIEIRGTRGSATLHLTPPVGTGFPTADVAVSGRVRSDGTFDLAGKLGDGTPLRIEGRSGHTIYLTIGTRTTEHTSPGE